MRTSIVRTIPDLEPTHAELADAAVEVPHLLAEFTELLSALDQGEGVPA
jgi:hypothetical protein